MGNRGPRSEAVRRAIAAKLKGVPHAPERRAKIAAAVRAAWAERFEREGRTKRQKVSLLLQRDKARWEQENSRLGFEDWLREQPLNGTRAKHLYPDGFFLYKHIDPIDGRLLHVGIVPFESELLEYQGSILKRNKRLREIFLSEELPLVEVVAKNLTYNQARKMQLEITKQERQRGQEEK